MKEYQAAEIRNFAIVGHASSGKTMLSEAMLATAGVINRMGTIAGRLHGFRLPRQRAAAADLRLRPPSCTPEWLGKKFNILDSPGYADFISEALGALRVSDFAADRGSRQSRRRRRHRRVWRFATENGIPKMIVVNAFDKEETDFEKTLAQIREHFGERVFPLTVPLNPGPGFNQVLDVPRNEIITFAADKSGKYTEAPGDRRLGGAGQAVARATHRVHRRVG